MVRSRLCAALLGALTAPLALADAPAGPQPAGALSGKIVYLHAGHGYTANNLSGGSWTTQRGETFDMIEDLGNQDALTFLADELWRAGATVAPIRPVGHQPHEAVLDNDDPGVTFSGAWNDSLSTVYFGAPGDVPYRFAAAGPTETAVARYTPDLPAAGFYPVYCWTRPGPDRVDQLYRVTHTGGSTEVRVDHARVGYGPVYLGTFHFDAGAGGFVEISNRSDRAGVVIADMIRFGNGVGDIDRGAGPSGQTREDEAALYWVQWHAERSQGIPTSAYRASADDGSATVSLSPRWAAFMNREQAGALGDRVFVSYHSNAGGGAARGVIGLVNGNNTPSSATPNQFLLADTLAREINDDLVAQNGAFEHAWADRSVLTLDRTDFEFGEINNAFINDEFDATIIETGFHDNQLDAEMLRDPRVRQALARATVQGLTRYFRAVDAGATPEAFLPLPPSGLRALSNADGSVTVSWDPPPAAGPAWDAPTGYRVFTSSDGLGFDAGLPVAGATSITLAGPGAGPLHVRVRSTNDAGWSAPSALVSAAPRPGAASVLIVNGFDRFERTLNPREGHLGGIVDRVRPRSSNARDYTARVAAAVHAARPDLAIDSADNEAVVAGQVQLGAYDAVVWYLGEESAVDRTFSGAEQFFVSSYVQSGGALITSGAEIAWDLDFLAGGEQFIAATLGAAYVADDANTYDAAGVPGSIFDAIALTFDNGSETFDAQFPDVLDALPGASVAMTYAGGTGGGAAVVRPASGTLGPAVTLGFPFVTILGEQTRADVMGAMLGFVLPAACPPDIDANGALNVDDIDAFAAAFLASDPAADCDGSGVLNLDDVECFASAFLAGCP